GEHARRHGHHLARPRAHGAARGPHGVADAAQVRRALRRTRERDAAGVTGAARALGILPGETGLALLVTAVMLLTSVGAAMGGAATEALFFARFDVSQLPLMYVALGAVTFVCTLVVSALLARPDRARLYAVIPLALG